MQIIQFLVGASYAALHSFISYTIPVHVLDVEASVKTMASTASSVASAAAAAATRPGFIDLVKKMIFRAVGDDGVAANVNAAISNPASSASKAADTIPQYRTEYQTIDCIDTSGQTFAIWFNVMYLAPLTVLFVRFFIRSYLRRTAAQQNGKAKTNGVAYQNGNPNGFANGTANRKR
jgi:hypothetical protein